MKADILIEKLNAPTAQERLEALKELKAMYDAGELEMPVSCGNVNNHIHTTYSFSPYSPTKAAYLAWLNGLTTAGIMDHDSVSGCIEFVEAGKILGIATTIGMECRVSVKKFADRRLNNPDQDGVAYCTIHGIPHQSLPIIEEFISPLREKRNIRNRKMVDNLNALLAKGNVIVDIEW
ncbi:MAG: PHP domain-containing protein, partial [Clostridia bacterium]|nr:PHP domain-containing protein [Clostridia bacterium]